MYTSYFELMLGYVDSLHGKSGYMRTLRVASQWIFKQSTTPTRAQIMARHKDKGKGDFMPGCVQANKELSIQRAGFRWGLYHGTWTGGDPTAGIKKWKSKKRKRIAKFLEVKALLNLFEFAESESEIRNRALIGLELFTGCRQIEARTARMGTITPYGDAGSWNKGKTKNGEDHEIPVPRQAMVWLKAWLDVRAQHDKYTRSTYIFPGINPREPLSEHGLRIWWKQIREELGMAGLWNYDLRRTLASYLSNELNCPDKKIQAILNHYDGRALSHYCHVSFDALVPVIQQYADWLCGLKDAGSSTALPERRYRQSYTAPVCDP